MSENRIVVVPVDGRLLGGHWSRAAENASRPIEVRRRVVALVAEGLTNPQIAERMFIARGTAKVHLEHIFAKLGLNTRSQLAAEATARKARA